MKTLAETRLYTFVDADYLHGRAPRVIAEQLCDGGADLIQIRAKDWTAEEVLRLAEQISPVADRAGVWWVINDHLQVAQAAGAPLCHLGQEDFFDLGHTHISELPRPDDGREQPKLGLSTHAPGQAERAIAAGADYVAIGPVFPTPTKPGRPPVTVEYVRWAAANVSVPWFAIGGINQGNLDEVLAAGARRICVVSAILDAPDVAKACREFRDRLD